MADSLSPSVQALRSAAKNRFAAKEFAAAATLALALKRRYPDERQASAVAKRILEATRDDLGQVELTCDRPCVVSVNGRATGDERNLTHRFFVPPGPIEVRASFENGDDRLPVTLASML